MAMPIYEYQCKPCGAKFEKLVRTMSSTEPVPCPECNSTQTARALSVFAVSSEAGASKASGSSDSPGCGRCGGPGPCAMG
jgi:putative FmdB family regulatory protein